MPPDDLAVENARLRRVTLMLMSYAVRHLYVSGVPVLTYAPGRVAEALLQTDGEAPLRPSSADFAADILDAMLAMLSADPTPITPAK